MVVYFRRNLKLVDRYSEHNRGEARNTGDNKKFVVLVHFVLMPTRDLNEDIVMLIEAFGMLWRENVSVQPSKII